MLLARRLQASRKLEPPGMPLANIGRIRSARMAVGIDRFKQFATRLLCDIAAEACDRKEYLRTIVAYRLALFLNRGNPSSLTGLRDLYIETGRIGEAIELEQAWLKGGSDDFFRHLDLVHLLLRLDRDSEAKGHMKAAAELDPDSPLLDLMRGSISRHEGRLDESTIFFRAALEKEPGHPTTTLELALNLSDMNRKDEAIRLLETMLLDNPGTTVAYSRLASLKYYKDPKNPHLITLKKFLSDGGKKNRKARLIAHFALGEALDSLGQYEEAFDHYRAGNELSWKSFDITEFTTNISRQIVFFDRDLLDEKSALAASAGARIAFIVGMPRSGSTLVEQILASHPEVRAGGERLDFPLLVDGLPGRIGTGAGYPDCVGQSDGEAIGRISDQFVHETLGLGDRGIFYVEKTLPNYLELGIISILFPEARIIHCRRNPLDTCLSAYFQNFANVAYSSNLRTLGLVYKQYERMMSHWHSVCPKNIIDIDYESMVSEPEMSMRKLLDFCGLPWHPGCLEFYLTQRPAKTASTFQVKSPIYSTSVGRWRNYQGNIGELIDALNFHCHV